MKNEKKTSIIIYGLSFLIFLAIGIWGRELSPGDEIGFVLLNLYIIMPITTLVMAFMLAIKKNPDKYLYPITFGTISVIVTNIIFPGFDISLILFSLLISFVPAMIGLTLGVLIYNNRLNKL